MTTALHDYFIDACACYPERTAVIEPGHGHVSYRALADLSDRVRDHLRSLGVSGGDRVGIYLHKSVDAVAAIYGILKAGAAYVPVDPGAPPARCAYILHNCGVKALIVEGRFLARLQTEFAALGPLPKLLALDGTGAGAPLRKALDAAEPVTRHPYDEAAAEAHPQDLAYILYTSGSTGRPKGVMLSHENAVSFVDWCSEVFQPAPEDVFSSHAPFHFDLSILDIHVALKHGASLVLVGEDIGKDPQRLAALIAEQKISIWYSAPSILALLAQFGNLSRHDYSRLRLVLFAGEVFAVKHLRSLASLLPGPRYFNLYGPTETNVCTFHEVPRPIPDERTTPYPIGACCSHLACRVVDGNGNSVSPGEEGELCVSGRGVMQGYWALPEQTAGAFLVDAAGTRWYRTGDIVVESPPGEYVYRGRRDRMIKRRGYRVELGEIEAGLYRHASIKEAAVLAFPNEEGVEVVAHLSCRESKRPSLVEMKGFCAGHLPLYMIPDRFVWHDALPKTSTDKIDYQQLKALR